MPISVTLTLYNDVNGVGAIENRGHLQIFALDIHGNIINRAGSSLDLQNVELVGDVNNPSGATIKIEGNAWVDEGQVSNAGNIMIFPKGRFCASELNNTGLISMFGGELDGGSVFNNNGVITGSGLVLGAPPINKGQICASSGALTIASEEPFCNMGTICNTSTGFLRITEVNVLWNDTMYTPGDANNLSTIEVRAGGSIAFDCNLANEPDGTIKLLGGTLAAATITQSANATFEGFGGITGNLVINPNGIIRLTGPTNIVGDVNITANATLEVSDGTTLITGHTTNNGDIRVVNGDVVFQDGYSGSGLVQKD